MCLQIAEVRQSKDICRNEKQKYVWISTFLNMICYAYIGKMFGCFYLTVIILKETHKLQGRVFAASLIHININTISSSAGQVCDYSLVRWVCTANYTVGNTRLELNPIWVHDPSAYMHTNMVN